MCEYAVGVIVDTSHILEKKNPVHSSDTVLLYNTYLRRKQRKYMYNLSKSSGQLRQTDTNWDIVYIFWFIHSKSYSKIDDSLLPWLDVEETFVHKRKPK